MDASAKVTPQQILGFRVTPWSFTFAAIGCLYWPTLFCISLYEAKMHMTLPWFRRPVIMLPLTALAFVAAIAAPCLGFSDGRRKIFSSIVFGVLFWVFWFILVILDFLFVPNYD